MIATDVAIGGSGHGSRDGLGDNARNVRFHSFRDLRRRQCAAMTAMVTKIPVRLCEQFQR